MNKINFYLAILFFTLLGKSNSLNVKPTFYSISSDLDCKNELDITFKFNNLFKNSDKSYVALNTINNSLEIEMFNIFINQTVNIKIKNTVLNNNQTIIFELVGQNTKVEVSFTLNDCIQEIKYFVLEENNVDFLSHNIDVKTSSYPVEFTLPAFELYAKQKITFSANENYIIFTDFSVLAGMLAACIIGLFI